MWYSQSVNLLFYVGVLSGLKEIIQRERFIALYKGNYAQMIRIFPYAATQFTTFESYKKVYIINSFVIFCIKTIKEIILICSG